MQLPDWLNNVTLYLAIGGGVVLLLALVLYFTSASRLKIPGIIFGILGGMGIGAALGVLALGYYEYQRKQTLATEEAAAAPAEGGGGGPPPNMAAMMGRGGMRGGGGGPSSKAQLAALVVKLDVLTQAPLEIKLTAEQKKKVRAQLAKLDEQEELSEEEAKAKLDALLDLLHDQRSTLEAAGYRGPGQGGGGRGGRGGRGQQGAAPANPFKTEENSKHLKALQGRLGTT